MRSFKQFANDIVLKPLIVFPLVGLAHVLWLLWIIWTNRNVPINNIEWLQALWMLGYIVFWIAICDYRRWGVWGYLALTILNASLFLTIKNINTRELYMSPIFLFDELFCFLSLLFY